MFCFKGTVSQDFLLQVFSWIIFSQASENPQICGLTNLLHLRTFHMRGNLRICEPDNFLQFADLQFADPNLLRTYNFHKSKNSLFFCLWIHRYLKCSNSNFYQIKNSVKQTCSWPLDSFAIKGGIFFKKMFNYLCLIVENLRTGSPTKFADLQFANLQFADQIK